MEYKELLVVFSILRIDNSMIIYKLQISIIKIKGIRIGRTGIGRMRIRRTGIGRMMIWIRIRRKCHTRLNKFIIYAPKSMDFIKLN